MADEPTGNLDSKTGLSILELFDELVRAGKTVLMVTHDASVGRRCNRVIALHDGSIVQDTRGGASSIPAPANRGKHLNLK